MSDPTYDEQADRDRNEVVEVNAEFYAAFERGDLDRMNDIWLDDPGTLCIHPGALPLRGASEITRSWALIMANVPYIQFFLTDVEVGVNGDTASVTCTENVLTADETTENDSFNGARAVATNVFLRRGDTWRLFIHHASPVMSGEQDED
jgi:ketosteroid isomerase-like protein